MQRATIIGRATATVKHSALNGWKLSLAQPLQADGTPDADPVLVIDPLGSSVGGDVVLTTDGKAVRELVGRQDCPIRFAVVALPD